MATSSRLNPLAIIWIVLILLIAGSGAYWLKNLSNSRTTSEQAQTELTVVATVPHVASWLQNILPTEHVSVTTLVRGELHDFSLTPDVVNKAQGAIALIANGAGLEPWAQELANGADTPLIETAPIDRVINSDPHTWLDVSIASKQVRTAADELESLLPQYAEIIEKKTISYIGRLMRLDQDIQTQLESAPRNTFVAYHNAFDYFARRYGIKQVGELKERPHDEPTFADVEKLLEQIKQYDVTTLFVEPGEVPDLAQSLSEEAGLMIAVLDPLETITPTAGAYIDAMERNTEALYTSLQ